MPLRQSCASAERPGSAAGPGRRVRRWPRGTPNNARFYMRIRTGHGAVGLPAGRIGASAGVRDGGRVARVSAIEDTPVPKCPRNRTVGGAPLAGRGGPLVGRRGRRRPHSRYHGRTGARSTVTGVGSRPPPGGCGGRYRAGSLTGSRGEGRGPLVRSARPVWWEHGSGPAGRAGLPGGRPGR